MKGKVNWLVRAVDWQPKVVGLIKNKKKCKAHYHKSGWTIMDYKAIQKPYLYVFSLEYNI